MSVCVLRGVFGVLEVDVEEAEVGVCFGGSVRDVCERDILMPAFFVYDVVVVNLDILIRVC